MPKWVITAMSLIGEKVIGFEDQAEVTSVPVVEIESGPNLEDSVDAQKNEREGRLRRHS